MPAETITSFSFFTFFNIMRECKVAGRKMFRVNNDIRVFIPARFQDIMISFYQVNTGLCAIFSPTRKKIVLLIHSAVKKITDDDELRRPEELYF